MPHKYMKLYVLWQMPYIFILDASIAGKYIIGNPDELSFQPYASGSKSIYHDVLVAVRAPRL